jgi:hypothetical protein
MSFGPSTVIVSAFRSSLILLCTMQREAPPLLAITFLHHMASTFESYFGTPLDEGAIKEVRTGGRERMGGRRRRGAGSDRGTNEHNGDQRATGTYEQRRSPSNGDHQTTKTNEQPFLPQSNHNPTFSPLSSALLLRLRTSPQSTS